jgi:hydrogenase-4 component B
MSVLLLLLASGTVAISGVPGLFLDRRRALGQWVAMGINVLGSMIGAAGLILHLSRETIADPIVLSWSLPWGHFAAGVDGISALFLIPMLLISALGSIYGLSYWKQSRHLGNGRKLRLCWGLLTAAMMMVILARDGVLFLIAWEIMALAAFFLVATEDKKPEVRQAAWVYLVATHVGTLCLFGVFGLLRFATGSFDLWPVASDRLASWLPTTLFVVGLAGFGLKAGIMPLHVWLPGAHANAPSHVSAMLSGVMLKAGIYGLIRMAGFLPHPPLWWGGTLLVLGGLSGMVGIAFAMAQHDFKRLLAYSSIENIGIIVMGIGLAVVGRSVGRSDLILLGLGGALFHVLNHSLFKPLLFMGAGSLLHAAHTRQMDRLGGLAKVMPRTFMLFVIGAVAICGLPPLNGFVSELLLYVGFFRSIRVENGTAFVWAGLAAPALALIGGLAVSGFVKLLGSVFAGLPRTADVRHAHDPGTAMLLPMIALAGGCVAIGIWPGALTGLIERAVAGWDPQPAMAAMSIAGMVPILGMSLIAAGLAAITLLAWAMAFVRRTRRPSASAGTWDCGYAKPRSTMQYTGSSFSEVLVDLFAWVLWPRRFLPVLRELFPGRTRFVTEVPDPVLDRTLLPGFRWAERVSALARPMQLGSVQLYLLYMLLVLVVLLVAART